MPSAFPQKHKVTFRCPSAWVLVAGSMGRSPAPYRCSGCGLKASPQPWVSYALFVRVSLCMAVVLAW